MQQNHYKLLFTAVQNVLTDLNLKMSGREKFYRLMVKEYTADATPRRMGVAIKALQKRFPAQNLNGDLTWALSQAAAKDNIPMMDFLLAQGAKAGGAKRDAAKLEPFETNPLLSAVGAGNKAAVSYLLVNKGVRPEPVPGEDATRYLVVAAEKDPEIVKMLVASGARKGAEIALYELIANKRDIETADYLIKKTGISVNVMDGKIPYTVLSDYGHRPRPYFVGTFLPEVDKRALEYLAKSGADFNAVARKVRREYTDDVPFVAELAEQWAARALRLAGFAPPVPAVTPAPKPVVVGQTFSKGTGQDLVAPEKASFKKRPRLAQEA